MKKRLISLAVAGAMTAPMITQTMTASEYVRQWAIKGNQDSNENWKGSGKRRMPKQG